jgi:putative peptide zinc metalloprotease protein
VSSAWKLPPAQRVIIDLAGIYLELLFCTALGLAFLLTQNYLFLNVSLVVMAATYINLNPLLRFDGYWATSDLLRVPNLRATSNRKLLAALAWAIGRGPQPLRSALDGFLVGYALASWAFIALFLVGVLVYNPNSLFRTTRTGFLKS